MSYPTLSESTGGTQVGSKVVEMGMLKKEEEAEQKKLDTSYNPCLFTWVGVRSRLDGSGSWFDLSTS